MVNLICGEFNLWGIELVGIELMGNLIGGELNWWGIELVGN